MTQKYERISNNLLSYFCVKINVTFLNRMNVEFLNLPKHLWPSLTVFKTSTTTKLSYQCQCDTTHEARIGTGLAGQWIDSESFRLLLPVYHDTDLMLDFYAIFNLFLWWYVPHFKNQIGIFCWRKEKSNFEIVIQDQKFRFKSYGRTSIAETGRTDSS